MTDIVANLAKVQARIAAACERAGRSYEEVRLLPVTKFHPAAALVAAHSAGITRFGENRVQEIEAKASELTGSGIQFALIGHLQTIKVNKVAGLIEEFQALDSVKLAAGLDRRLQALGRSIDVMIEVNSSGEDSKFGLRPDDVKDFAAQLVHFDCLNPIGIMTIAANTYDQTRLRHCFKLMADLRNRLQEEQLAGSQWPELSMGMSNDYELAIECGATCVRGGTAIFGARNLA